MIGDKTLQKKIYLLVFLMFVSLYSDAGQLTHQGSNVVDTVKRHVNDSIILNKAFYLLAAIRQSNDLQGYIRKDNVFNQITTRKIKRADAVLSTCGDISCYATAIKWNPYEIYLIGNELASIAQRNAVFRDILVGALKRNGSYINYEKYGEVGMIKMAWYDCALGINQIIDVYIKGEWPLYPAIDSISFRENDPQFDHLIYRSVDSILKRYDNKASLFFEIPLQVALTGLEINGRDEAARYEPITGGMNRNPFDTIGHIQWSSFRYSVILVPGEGPKRQGIALNPLGAYRCRLAAERFKKGLAPFIVVSGGHVHPYKTPFSEAVEMKKYLVDSLNIPDNAIIIEPHARHTTTNIRNTCRIIYHFNIPVKKPVVIVTDPDQNNYILHLDARCRKELGYLPYQGLKEINKFESTFYPTDKCLQANPLDPLDP